MKIRRLTGTGEWTTRRYLSLLGTVLIWIIVAIDGWYLWPTQLGGDTSIVVVSGASMEPTYVSGDLVIARTMEPSVGDVIVYAPAGFGGSQIVHRIIGGSADEGWRMQGDNNDFVDPFTPKADEVKGVVLVHYSTFGRVTVLLLNPMVWAFVLLAAMILMLWYSGDECDDDDDDDDDESEDKKDGDPGSEAEGEPDLIDRVVEGVEASVARMVAAGAAAGAATLAAVTSRAHVLRPASPALLRGSAILGVVGLLALSSMSPASASQLGVNTGGQASVFTLHKCGTQSLAATASGTDTAGVYTSMSVAGISPACQSPRLLTVDIHLVDGTIKHTAAMSASGSTVVVEVPGGYTATQVTKVVVKIDGWLFVATWTAPTVTIPAFSCTPVNNGGNAVPGNGQSCLVTDVTVTQWLGGASNLYQYKKVTFTVTSSTSDFLVTFNLGDSATYGAWPAGTPTRVWSNGNAIKATVPTPAYSCASLPMVSVNRNLTLNPSGNSYEIQASNDPNAWVGVGAPNAVCP